MKINKEILKALRPCIDRWENYLKHYSDFDGSLEEFLSLSELSSSDKLFVIKKLVNVKSLAVWAQKCAESVKHYNNSFSADSACYATYAADYAAQWELNYKMLIQVIEENKLE